MFPFRVLLKDAPRWLLLFLLVEAPWLYGSTRAWTVTLLECIGALILLLWALRCVVERRRPSVQLLLLAATVFLAVQGCFLIANAQGVYDRAQFHFVARPSFWPGGPGAIDVVDAIPGMFRVSVILGLMCFSCDLSRRPVWRKRMWWTVLLTGGTLTLFGLIAEVSGQQLIGEDGETKGSPFATYLYHANAAAFINLVIPPIAGLMFLSFRRGGTTLERAVAIPALLLCLGGAAASASKAGMAITAGLLAVLGLWEMRRRIRDRGLTVVRAAFFVGVSAIALALATHAVWSRVGAEVSRVPGIIAEGTGEGRLLAAQVCLRMLPDAGAWGIGAGNFAIAFPHYTGFLGDKLEGAWEVAHEDYLQTAVEWGIVGAAVWSVILIGGMAAGTWSYFRRAAELSRGDRTLLFCLVAAVAGVAAHAFVDFPLQIASIQLYVAVYLGALWGSAKWRTNRST